MTQQAQLIGSYSSGTNGNAQLFSDRFGNKMWTSLIEEGDPTTRPTLNGRVIL